MTKRVRTRLTLTDPFEVPQPIAVTHSLDPGERERLYFAMDTFDLVAPLAMAEGRMAIAAERLGPMKCRAALTAYDHVGVISISLDPLDVPEESVLSLHEMLRYVRPLYVGHERPRLEWSWDGKEGSGSTETWLETAAARLGIPRASFDLIGERCLIAALVHTGEAALSPERLYRIVQVDPPAMQPPPREVLAHFLEDSLYRRWKDTGLVYGFSHYSFAAVEFGSEPRAWLEQVFEETYAPLARLIAWHLGLLRSVDRGLRWLPPWGRKEVIRRFHAWLRERAQPRVSEQDQGRELFRRWWDVVERDHGLEARLLRLLGPPSR